MPRATATAKPRRPSAPPPWIGQQPAAMVRAWFAARGWSPFAFQEEAWDAFAGGESGLINVPTGAGKTYAAYLGPLAAVIEELQQQITRGASVSERTASLRPRSRTKYANLGLRILFVTPLRAVSRDTEAALKLPVTELNLPLRVESRTGDTSSSVRARQRQQLPEVLVTTPESLSLILTQENARDLLGGVLAVIADEWHELLASKRGTQTELALARLRSIAPRLRTWGLSATLANLGEAAQAVVGNQNRPTIIRARIDRPLVIESVIPEEPGRLPWAGHMGLRMLPDVVKALDPDRSTLIFTNTRAQAELWYQAIGFAKPDWRDVMALHHGSIERSERERVERGVKGGSIRLVVCTSSLDLGVDFAPVERVVQIGSPKGVARLLQRAGRSGHRPGADARIICVPTHAMELLEVESVRRAIAEGVIEPRLPLSKPLDVLAQHLVTCALGGGFDPDLLFEEVRTAWSYRNLSRQEFDWALALVREGGGTLRAYPMYHKVVAAEDGRYRVTNPRIAQLHRLNLGTITAGGSVQIRYTSGRPIGAIDEPFITSLHPGEVFYFAGKTLQFVRLADLEAFVRPARGRTTNTPRWSGTKLPISESLSEEMRKVLSDEATERRSDDGLSKEVAAAQPILNVQRRVSRIPAHGQVLCEISDTREGHHLFVFPFEGRLVHGGLASIIALRLSRLRPATFSIVATDYGFELLTPEPMPYQELLTPDLFSTERLVQDALDSVNVSALARTQFREIARVAGLVFQTYPGAKKSGRQMQASSGLLYEVFAEFDPENLLLLQARREVLERHFEQSRLARTLQRMAASELTFVNTRYPSPLAFPLLIERIGAKLSSESIADRIDRMRMQWDEEAQQRDTQAAVKKQRIPKRFGGPGFRS
jgi:ATP-dependent helicase Lhr and Lhr-like helicase